MMKSNAEKNDMFKVLKKTYKNFILVLILICDNHLYCMGRLGNLTDVTPISEYAENFIQTTYAMHGLSDQIADLEFYVSYDKKMTSLESIYDKNRDKHTGNWMICMGHCGDKKAVFISPFLNDMIILSEIDDQGATVSLKTSRIVIFELLNILGQKDYEHFPNTKEGLGQLHNEAKQFVLKHACELIKEYAEQRK